MAPSVPKGSYLIVSLTSPVERGDVVVFRLPRDGKTPYIKRLIGMPGDQVRFTRGVLSINGAPVVRQVMGTATISGVKVTRIKETLPNSVQYETYDMGPDHDGDTTDTFHVPEGQYFFVGDNRDNSLDSRWPGEFGIGYVPKANIIGKVVWMQKGSGR
jgi:signal peptidase I